MLIKSILIANRGEIAVRIVRAAKALGIKTIQAYSDADAESLAVKLADESINIGGARSSTSYLNIDNIICAAKEKQVDAIHPGYGFLSENADFADAVTQAGLIFIGPSAEVIRILGDKANAIAVAKKVGVPTVPGSGGVLADVEQAVAVCNQIGYPVMIKAKAGGGGKGIRLAHTEEQLRDLFPKAFSEAQAIFGDGMLYIEKYIEDARHIEVQVLGDGKKCIHLFERECSLQRKRQKIREEAPATCLSNSLREELCKNALKLVQSVNYSGAGTVEYIYDNKEQKFYFIEVNTRIQVEHPVTEMLTGIDLVQEMIKISGGVPLSITQNQVQIKGHAIECRINAENPSNGFMPSPGVITSLKISNEQGIRFDTFLYESYKIPVYYDSLIGKLIVWAEDRTSATKKLKTALEQLKIEGIHTTIPLHISLTENQQVLEDRINTSFLEEMLSEIKVLN